MNTFQQELTKLAETDFFQLAKQEPNPRTWTVSSFFHDDFLIGKSLFFNAFSFKNQDFDDSCSKIYAMKLRKKVGGISGSVLRSYQEFVTPQV